MTDPRVEGRLGRRIFSKKSAKAFKRKSAPHNEFMPPPGDDPPVVSVDGLSVGALGFLADLARKEAARRKDKKGRSRSFYGWAYVRREVAQLEGKRIVPDPTPENPHHEEIHLPPDTAGNREEQKHHASLLADSADWLCCSDSSAAA